MKKLGLIGGIGPEATVAYYRKIIHGIQAKAGREVLPPLSIESLNAFTVFRLCRENRLDALTDYVLGAVHNLAAAGAELAALTGNTPNIVLERVQARSPIPIVSAIEATCVEAQRRGVGRVGLLGTRFTMNSDFFKLPFERCGIPVVIPDEGQIAWIQEKIESELEHGIVTEGTRQAFIDIIQTLKEHEAIDQIVLGCTELPLLLNDDNSPLPCLDTVDIHVRAIVDDMCA